MAPSRASRDGLPAGPKTVLWRRGPDRRRPWLVLDDPGGWRRMGRARAVDAGNIQELQRDPGRRKPRGSAGAPEQLLAGEPLDVPPSRRDRPVRKARRLQPD